MQPLVEEVSTSNRAKFFATVVMSHFLIILHSTVVVVFMQLALPSDWTLTVLLQITSTCMLDHGLLSQ